MRPSQISHEEVMAFMEYEYRQKLRDLKTVRLMPRYREDVIASPVKTKDWEGGLE
jgi:hypothetical protein